MVWAAAAVNWDIMLWIIILVLARQGQVEGYEDKYYYGRRANGIYIPRFRNLFGDKRDYLRGFGYQGGASREGWSSEIAEINIGGDFKEALIRTWTMDNGYGRFWRNTSLS